MTNEWTKEIERLTYERDQWEAKWRALRDQYATTRMALDSTRDNDAVVSAAVAAERARIRAAIVPLYQPSVGAVLAIVGGAP